MPFKIRMLKKKSVLHIPGDYVPEHPGEIFRLNGNSLYDAGPNGVLPTASPSVTISNGVYYIGAPATEVLGPGVGTVHYLLPTLVFGLQDFTVQVEFTIHAGMTNGFELFSIGSFGAIGSLSMFRENSGLKRVVLRINTPSVGNVDFPVPVEYITIGERFKFSIERWAGYFYFFVNDAFIGSNRRYSPSENFNPVAKRVFFGGSGYGSCCGIIHNARIIKGEALTAPNMVIFGSEGTTTTSKAVNILSTDDSLAWGSGTTDPNLTWVGYRQGKEVDISRAEINFTSNTSVLAGYAIEYSNDGLAWNSAYQFNGNPPTGAVTVSFPSKTGRYWRIRLLWSGAAGTRGIMSLRFLK